jgi:hypothetical protein
MESARLFVPAGPVPLKTSARANLGKWRISANSIELKPASSDLKICFCFLAQEQTVAISHHSSRSVARSRDTHGPWAMLMRHGLLAVGAFDGTGRPWTSAMLADQRGSWVCQVVSEKCRGASTVWTSRSGRAPRSILAGSDGAGIEVAAISAGPPDSGENGLAGSRSRAMRRVARRGPLAAPGRRT